MLDTISLALTVTYLLLVVQKYVHVTFIGHTLLSVTNSEYVSLKRAGGYSPV